MKKLYVLATAALALMACSKESAPETVPDDPEVVEPVSKTVRLNAEIKDDGLSSKTSLTDEDGSRYIRWDSSDAIGIVCGGQVLEGNIDSATIDADGKTAEFTYPKQDSDPSYAFYPYSSDASVSGSTLSFSIPTEQTYSSTSVFAPGVCLMTAKYADSKLSFSNACSIIEFQLTGDETISRASLRSESSFLSGDGTIDMSADVPAFAPGSDAKHHVELIFNDGLALSTTPVAIYFVIPAGTYSDLQLVTEGAGGSARIKSTASHTVAVNHILPMKSAAISRDMSGTNLSSEGTANCYIVDPDATGRYVFDAKKVSGTAVSGTIADVLWQSESGLIDDVVYDAAAGTIAFDKEIADAGNALICLFDNSHNVVWSWHIWMSKVNDQLWGRATTYTASQHGFASTRGYHTFMDRNLGATFHPVDKGFTYNGQGGTAYFTEGVSYGELVTGMTAAEAAAACGLLYQYGRPVPFPSRSESSWSRTSGYEGYLSSSTGSTYKNKDNVDVREGVFSDMTAAVVFSPWYDGYEGWELRNMNIGKDAMAAYPNVFNKVIAGSSAFASYQAAWANDIHVTGSNAEWAATKTDADPCPVGYRVPSKDDLYNFKVDGANYPWRESTTISGYFIDNSSDNSWFPFLRYYHPYSESGNAVNYGAYTLTYKATDSSLGSTKGQVLYIPYAGWRAAGGSNPRNNNYTGGLSVASARFWCFDANDSFTSSSDCSFEVYQTATKRFGSNNELIASGISSSVTPYLSQNSTYPIYGEGDIFAQYLEMTATGTTVSEPCQWVSSESVNHLLLGQAAAGHSVRCVKQ